MTDDVAATGAVRQAQGVEIARPISDQGWGLLTAIILPAGSSSASTRPSIRSRHDRHEFDHPRSGRSGADGGSRESKTFISQAGCLDVASLPVTG